MKLYNLTRAVASFEDIGYTQGMNFICASFLFHCDEPRAFFLICKLLKRMNFHYLLKNHLSGVKKQCYIFWHFLREKNYMIFEELRKKEIEPHYFLTSWFITLGTNILPFEKHIRFFQFLLEK